MTKKRNKGQSLRNTKKQRSKTEILVETKIDVGQRQKISIGKSKTKKKKKKKKKKVKKRQRLLFARSFLNSPIRLGYAAVSKRL